MYEYIYATVGTLILAIIGYFGIYGKFIQITRKAGKVISALGKIVIDISNAAEDHVLDETEVKQIIHDSGLFVDDIRDLSKNWKLW